MCVHVGVSIHVCISTPVHMCVCLWRPENNFGYCYSSGAVHLHIFFLTGSLTGLELTEPAKTLAPYPHVPTDPPISASPELGLQE